jgi:hypothetical protein
MLCEICGTEAMYQCPQCRIPYCSVRCCREHKQRCQPPGLIPPDPPQSQSPPFEAFRAYPEIIKALGDPRLQAIITRIDSSRDRESDLITEVSLNPEFATFVDHLIAKMPPGIVP